MIVTSIEGMQLVDGPEQIGKPDPDFLVQYGCCAYQNIEAVRPEDLAAYVAGIGPQVYGVYQENAWALDNSGSAVVPRDRDPGGDGLVPGQRRRGRRAARRWPSRSRSPRPSRSSLLPLDLVTPAGPFVATSLLVLALLPLADGIAARIDDPSARRAVRLGALAVGIGVDRPSPGRPQRMEPTT